jgi:gluconokinase
MHVLALDIGTSSCRAARYDRRGRRVGGLLAQRRHRLITDGTGRGELDPAAVLRGAIGCMAGALAGHPAPIAAVGISCFWHSTLGLGRDGSPVTPVITWADSRCAADAARLRQQHDEAAWHARTGCMLRTSYWAPRLAWLARSEARMCRRVVRWVSPSDWITAQLLGSDPLTITTAHGMATGSGLYAPDLGDWDHASLTAIGLDAHRLPRIDDCALDAQSCRWQALRAVPWFPAIGDGAAHSLGAGAAVPRVAALNVGTSAAIRLLCRPNSAVPLGLFRYRIDQDRELVGGAISNAGGLRQWCCDHLRLPPERVLERVLAQRPGPLPGPEVLPFWLAERAPTWRDAAGGMIRGLTQATTAVDLYQAITEASYQRLAMILARLPRPRGLCAVASGGVQRSPQALQRLADVLGIPLGVSREAELSLRGAAIRAWEQLGTPVATLPPTRLIQPRAVPHAAYRRQRDRLAAWEATVP